MLVCLLVLLSCSSNCSSSQLDLAVLLRRVQWRRCSHGGCSIDTLLHSCTLYVSNCLVPACLSISCLLHRVTAGWLSMHERVLRAVPLSPSRHARMPCGFDVLVLTIQQGECSLRMSIASIDDARDELSILYSYRWNCRMLESVRSSAEDTHLHGHRHLLHISLPIELPYYTLGLSHVSPLMHAC